MSAHLLCKMKFITVSIFALASLTAASPAGNEKHPKCTPATYKCSKDPQSGQPGWDVCNTSGAWVVSAHLSMTPPPLGYTFHARNNSNNLVLSSLRATVPRTRSVNSMSPMAAPTAFPQAFTFRKVYRTSRRMKFGDRILGLLSMPEGLECSAACSS